MPREILTTGDEGTDRELDALWRAIPSVATSSAPAPASHSPYASQEIPTELDDLDDVNALSPSTNDALVWNGSEWVNSAVVNSVASSQDINVSTSTGASIQATIDRRAWLMWGAN